MARNALLNVGPEAQPKYDLVGPTVDDDVRRLLNRYGRDAVATAMKRAMKGKRGRKATADWPEIDKILKMDARRLLEGGDPFAERTNYSIAKAYAEQCPGHSHAATHRRILKKLAQKRVLFTYLNAFIIGDTEYPHSSFISILRKLPELMPHGNWDRQLALAESQLRDYTAKYGAPPDEMSMKDIEEGAQRAVISTFLEGGRTPPGGIFGLAGKMPPGD